MVFVNSSTFSALSLRNAKRLSPPREHVHMGTTPCHSTDSKTVAGAQLALAYRLTTYKSSAADPRPTQPLPSWPLIAAKLSTISQITGLTTVLRFRPRRTGTLYRCKARARAVGVCL